MVLQMDVSAIGNSPEVVAVGDAVLLRGDDPILLLFVQLPRGPKLVKRFRLNDRYYTNINVIISAHRRIPSHSLRQVVPFLLPSGLLLKQKANGSLGIVAVGYGSSYRAEVPDCFSKEDETGSEEVKIVERAPQVKPASTTENEAVKTKSLTASASVQTDNCLERIREQLFQKQTEFESEIRDVLVKQKEEHREKLRKRKKGTAEEQDLLKRIEKFEPRFY